IRRMLEAASRTFPVTFVLFIPIALGMQHLYSWSRPAVIAKDHLLQHKTAYLNVPFFLGRAAFYFAIWIALAHVLSKWSLDQDRNGAEPAHTRMQLLSGPGLLLYGFTVTFSSIDWIMSLDPHWFSTIFGILFMGGQGVSALAFVILVIVLLIDFHPVSEAIFPRHLHDYGKLLFAFVMLWAYFSFSQFLIVWSANLPEEIPFYLKRMTGGWKWIGLALILLHFVLPFLLLLSQNTKKNYRTLWRIAALVFFMRFVDLFWIAAPNFQPAATMSIHWLDIAVPVGVGGIWLAAFFRQLRQRPLLPAYEPQLEEALEHEHH
ncbi:MAG: hypothetical protein ABIZ80_22320, partial [Bryobacteraceae bacterium]